MAPGSSPDASALIAGHGDTLLDVARSAIDHRIAHGRAAAVEPERYPEALRMERASFVTLFLEGELRGCIGKARPCLPLIADVAENAVAAAFDDRRFDPLTAREARRLDIEVSVLDESRPLPFTDAADLFARLRPAVDGVILEGDGKRALFLPDVWAKIPDARNFIAHLMAKADLPDGYPVRELDIRVFTTASTLLSRRGA